MVPTFSVIMPFLLREEKHNRVFQETIDSVLKYSHDYEFIAIDDDSQFEYDPNFCDRLVKHKINQGIAPSWNDGIRLARGKYIAVINDDIVVCPDWLEGMKACFEDNLMKNTGVAAPGVEHLPDLPSGIHEKQTWFPGSCFMLSQETIKQVGYFDERFVPFNCEDIDYWERLTLAGLKMYRNFDYFIQHKEGDVLHGLDYKAIDDKNIELLIEKWGYDPRPKFYD